MTGDMGVSKSLLAQAALMVGELLLSRRGLVTTKSVTSVVTGYRDDLTRNFQDVLDGSMTIGEASRAHRSSLRHDAEMVYIEGLAEGDVPANEIDNDDRMAISQWVQEQSGYVSGLWQDIKRIDSSDTAAIRDMYGRIGMWADSLRSLGAVARASALANTMGTWHLGKTEQHCASCSKLDGTRHRLSYFTSRGLIPQQPGSETLACGGWACDCTVRSDKGKVLLP
jgi:hypothetical protein